VATDQGWGADFEKFDPVEYRQAMQSVAWSKGGEKNEAAGAEKATTTDTLCERIQRLPGEDQAIIRALVERLERR